MKKNSVRYSHWIYSVIILVGFSIQVPAQSIIGYYSGKSKQYRSYPTDKCSHIIFSFLHLRGSRLHVDNRSDTLAIRALVALKKKQPSLKILLSLGGWGGCETCSEIFSKERNRYEFAESVLALTQYFHTDGIDLDWEFPALAAFPDHPFKVEDKVNFTSLILILRKTLGNSKEISVICAAISPFLEGSLDLPAIEPYVDRINLMTYDLIGSTIHFSGHHCALYSTSWQVSSANHAVRYLDSLKIPHKKIAIGIAFYGREYKVLENHDEGLDQPAQFEKFVTMRNIRKKYTDDKGYKTHWDPEAQAAYKYNDANKLYLTYDDERSVTAKVKYVKEKGLNGVFFWELRLDVPKHGLLDVIYKEIRE
jgi:chitinase